MLRINAKKVAICSINHTSVFKVVWGLPNWTIQMHSRWSSFLLGKGAYKGSARSSSAADQVIKGFRGLPAVPSDLAPPAALATRPGFPLLQFPAFFFFSFFHRPPSICHVQALQFFFFSSFHIWCSGFLSFLFFPYFLPALHPSCFLSFFPFLLFPICKGW